MNKYYTKNDVIEKYGFTFAVLFILFSGICNCYAASRRPNTVAEVRQIRLLVQASTEGNLLEVERMIREGCPIVTCSEGPKPLARAARGGHIEVVKILLAAGADLNMLSDVIGIPVHTALAAAVSASIRPNRMRKITRLLLDAGADPNVPLLSERRPGITPLQVIADARYPNNIAFPLIKMLLDAGARKDAANYFYRSGFRIEEMPAGLARRMAVSLKRCEDDAFPEYYARAKLIDAYPGTTLAERAIFSIVFSAYSNNKRVRKTVLQHIEDLKKNLPYDPVLEELKGFLPELFK